MEYCIQAWRPYLKKDIDKLERIQQRAIKTIPELRDLSYESCLLECGLTTLETRRLRGDQIEVFKIVNGSEDVDRNMFGVHLSSGTCCLAILLNLECKYVHIGHTNLCTGSGLHN